MANPAFSASSFDRKILENFSIFFYYVSGFDEGLDKKNNKTLVVNKEKWQLPLQFPPKITKHERPFEIRTLKFMGMEPFISFKENDGQKLTLEFTYIVEGGYWTGARISTILKRLRSYPMTFKADGTFKNIRVEIPKFWLFGGFDEMGKYMAGEANAPFVFENINISFTDTLIADRSGSSEDARSDSGVHYDKIFPLRTNVAIGLISSDSDSTAVSNSVQAVVTYRTPRPVEWQ